MILAQSHLPQLNGNDVMNNLRQDLAVLKTAKNKKLKHKWIPLLWKLKIYSE